MFGVYAFFCVFVVLCLCSGLATGQSLVQGLLPSVEWLKEWKKNLDTRIRGIRRANKKNTTKHFFLFHFFFPLSFYLPCLFSPISLSTFIIIFVCLCFHRLFLNYSGYIECNTEDLSCQELLFPKFNSNYLCQRLLPGRYITDCLIL
jgi:hypothetical protein